MFRRLRKILKFSYNSELIEGNYDKKINKKNINKLKERNKKWKMKN